MKLVAAILSAIVWLASGTTPRRPIRMALVPNAPTSSPWARPIGSPNRKALANSRRGTGWGSVHER